MITNKKICIAATVAFLIALLAASPAANAHHLRGLPHYSYQENYSETPTFEETHEKDGYEISFSYFDIHQTKNIDLAVVVKEIETGKPFTGPVTFQVYGLGEEITDTHPFVAEPNPTNTYKAIWVYEEEGIYFFRVTFSGPNGPVTDEFRMAMGKVGFNKPLVFGGVGGIVVLMLAVAFVRGRKEKAGESHA